MRLPEDLSTLRSALNSWLETPAPALGDYAYGVKLFGFGAALLILLWLLDHGFKLLLSAVRSFIAGWRSFWDKALPPEVPGADADDESEALEADLASVLDSARSTTFETAEGLAEAARVDAESLVAAVVGDCRESVSRLQAAFREKPPEALVGELEIEAKRLGHILLDTAAKQRLDSARRPSGAAFVEKMETALRNEIRRVKTQYLVRQIKEELSAEPGDSLFVKAFKLHRRLLLLVSGFLGKARAQGRIRRVPLRELLVHRLIEDLREPLSEAAEELDRRRKEVSAQLREAGKVARFNLHSAGALLETDPEAAENQAEGARQLAMDGLDRTVGKVESIPEDIRSMYEGFAAAVKTIFEDAERQIRADSDVADTLGERVQEAVDAALASWRILGAKGHAQLRSTRSRTGAIRQKAAEAWARVQEHFGLREPQIQSSQAALDEATVEFALKDTPPLYRRLFRFDALSDEDFLIGREDAMAVVRSVKERFEEGLSSVLAVTGPLGSGKTSFLNCALQRYFPETEPLRGAPEEHLSSEAELVAFIAGLFGGDQSEAPADLPALIAKLRGLPKKPVIVIEGGSRFHLRTVGGFDAVRSLFALLSATEGKVFWAFSFSAAGWSYLDATFGLGRRFDGHAPLAGLGRAELETAVMARHEVSGYELEFVEGPGLGADLRWRLRKVRDEETRQALLREEFFEDLSRAAGPSLHAALYHWLAATKGVGRRKVRVSPVTGFRKGNLSGLTMGELFALLYALQHDRITPSMHSRLLRSTLTESRTLLDFLARKRVLVARREPDKEPVYEPNAILFEPMMDILRDRNFIHA